jgi:hypothetical protein
MSIASRTGLDVDVVSALIISGAHCVPCIVGIVRLPIDCVTAAFRQIEAEWSEPLVSTAPCASCQATTTVYYLKLA